MKSPPTCQLPKLIGSLAPSASGGFAKARALDGVDTPYLTAAGPGFITRKKNGTTEIEVLGDDTAAPAADVWLRVIRAAYYSGLPVVVGVGQVELFWSRSGQLVRRVKVDPITAGAPLEDSGQAALWVGGGRILVMVQSAWPARYVSWPVLINPTNGFEVEPGDATYAAHSVSLISSAANDADPFAFLIAPAFLLGGGVSGIFVSGWDGARYRWGYSFMANYSSDQGSASTPYYNNNIWAVLGKVQDTASAAVARRVDDFAVSRIALPTPAGTHSTGNPIICVGPGKLLTISAESTYARDNNPSTSADIYISPRLYLSSDHGNSWSSSSAAFIDALMPTTAAQVVGGVTYPSRKRPWDGRLSGAYLGGGLSLITFTDFGTAATPSFISACFLYDSSGFTQVSWPVKTTASAIIELVCFGPGCGAAVVYSSDIIGFESGNFHVVFTHDAGTTWKVSSTLPAPTGVKTRQSAFKLTVLEPFIQGGTKGKVMLSWTDQANLQVRRTDGLFQKFASSQANRKVDVRNGVALGPVPFLHRTKVNLALPTEFNKP